MNEDELRDRLGRLDPVPDDVPVEPMTTPSSRARLEQIMNTPVSPPTDRPVVPPSRNRWLIAAAAALVVLVVAGFAIASLGDDADDVADGPPLVLDLGADDPMASCMVPDATILADMSPAFAGTATSIDGEIVTLTVDRWYAGGDAAIVELHAQPGLEALIAGFSFEQGEQYLVTAGNGTVNFCGYSGPATPELQALFDEAFPA